jgi:predicted  nucleic acid-binding Zn-ribbon protein
MNKKDEYIAKAEAELKKLEASIAALRAQALERGGDAQTAFRDQTDKLSEQRVRLEVELSKLRTASTDAWNDIKSGVEAAFTELKSGYERARKRIAA